MSGARPLRPGEPSRLDQYRLVGRLGSGGQGVVYLAETPRREQVAIKILHARRTDRDRFLREVMAARKVESFCTARVLDVSVTDNTPYIVSEYIPGESLHDRVRRSGRLDLESAMRVSIGTISAMAVIHHAGIVHRDFKPGNVLLSPDGPRVVDFGIAKPHESATHSTGRIFGTPAYMSPEQVRGEHVGTPSDVFSWASTMVFAITGTTPFGHDDVQAIMTRIVKTEPDLSRVSRRLRYILAACLAKNPEDRPTARQVLRELVERNSYDPALAEDIERARKAALHIGSNLSDPTPPHGTLAHSRPTEAPSQIGPEEFELPEDPGHRLALIGASLLFILVIAIAVFLVLGP
ncbi:serine/threonine protein kinase [Streptosporangiaceae bacterium NEAU-GS5]|nr:serine/threonine protein kinase [Streptosporangiaceae bacterium NEAU-GS5]